MKFTVKRIGTIVAATGLLAVAMPAAGASAAPLPPGLLPGLLPSSLQMPGIDFTPPQVGQISVDIGPTIIGGKVMDPGLHVSSPGTSLPPINLPPRTYTFPRPR